MPPPRQADLLSQIWLAPEHETLREGGVLARVMPSADPDITLACAIRVNASATRIMSWAQAADDYMRGGYVPATGRFSAVPRIEDVRGLELNEGDLKGLRKCEPGDCSMKLSAQELQRLHDAANSGYMWRDATQRAFRQVIVDRARAYLGRGLAGADPYNDKKAPTELDREFRGLMEPRGLIAAGMPDLANYLLEFPRAALPEVDSYLFWSVSSITKKPIVSVSQALVFRPRPPHPADVVIVQKTIFATHYVTAGLAVIAVGRPDAANARDLVYLNRSRLDLLHGVLAPIYRSVISDRVEREAPSVLLGLRRHLERER